jgi:hypothetical protein
VLGHRQSGLRRRITRRLTETTSDLVFLDLPRRVAKMLLSQPRNDERVVRQQLTQEEYARLLGRDVGRPG